MQNVLADLSVESEAATASMMRLARSYDEAAAGDERAELFKRIATPVLKYWICKRAPSHAVESLECLGGNGYVEESGMPRLFRESPLMSIWEGSGNVQCLDALRAMVKSPASTEVLFDEIDEARGADARLDDFTDRLDDSMDELTRDPRGPGPPRGRGHGPRPPGFPAGPPRRPGGRRRLLRLPPRRRLGRRLRHPPGGHPISRRSSTEPPPV